VESTDRIMPDEKSSKTSLIVQLARYSEIAVIFPAATAVGWLCGVALDRWLHSTWLYLVGLILGIVAGFVQLIRMASSLGRDQ
jgi:ATP synthase protein I